MKNIKKASEREETKKKSKQKNKDKYVRNRREQRQNTIKQ